MIDFIKLKTDLQTFLADPSFDNLTILTTVKNDLDAYILTLPSSDTVIKPKVQKLLDDINAAMVFEKEIIDPKEYQWVDLIDIHKLEELYGKNGIDGILKKLIAKLQDVNSDFSKALIAELNKLYLSINGGKLLGPLELFPYSETDDKNNPKKNQQLAATVKYVDDAIATVNGFDQKGFDTGTDDSGSGEYLERINDVKNIDYNSNQIAYKNIILPDYTKVKNFSDHSAASKLYVDNAMKNKPSKTETSGNYVEKLNAKPVEKTSNNDYVKNNLILPTPKELNDSNMAISKGYVDGLFTAKNIVDIIDDSKEFKDAVLKIVPKGSNTSTTVTTDIDYSKIDYSKLAAELLKKPTELYNIIEAYHKSKGLSHGKLKSYYTQFGQGSLSGTRWEFDVGTYSGTVSTAGPGYF